MNDYYGEFPGQGYPEDETTGRSLSEKKTLEMTLAAMRVKNSAAAYYKSLENMMIADDDRRLVHGIMLDKIKHMRFLEEIYMNFAGLKPDTTNATPVADDEGSPRGTLPSIFSRRLLDELYDTEFCRQIYFALNSLEYRDVLFEITTDGLRHAQILNYLYTKYLK